MTATVNEKPSTELVPQESAVTLFRTENPLEIVVRATEVADALAPVIKQKKLYKRIGVKDHVFVEGWTFLGTMLGVFPICVWSQKLENGWEARVEARTKEGVLIGGAEAMCLRSESKWAKSDEYAIRSMAQTRATSKALRMPLGFVMTLAGYAATPAEEMIEDAEVTDLPDALRPDTDYVTCSVGESRNIWRLITKLDKDGIVTKDDSLEAIGKLYGTEKPAELYKHQATELITRLKAKAGEE